MGNVQWGPCGGKKRIKSSSQRNGLAATGQRRSESETLETAASSGYGNYGSYGGGGYGLGGLSYGLDCPEGIDEDLALLATAATLAASLWVLYRQIIINTVGRRKRSLTSKSKGPLQDQQISFNPNYNLKTKINDIKSDKVDAAIGQPNGIGFMEGLPIWTFIESGTIIR